MSLPDVVAARYKSEAVRFLMALTIVLGVMGYLATQILAMAVVMKSLLGGTVMFADLSLISCVVVSLSGFDFLLCDRWHHRIGLYGCGSRRDHDGGRGIDSLYRNAGLRWRLYRGDPGHYAR